MRRLIILALTMALTVSIAGPVAAIQPPVGGGTTFVALLNGDNEVNQSGRGAGDPDGFGIAIVNVNASLGRVCWLMTVRRIDPATLAHIHRAPKDVNGPVVVDLMPPLPNPTSYGCTNGVSQTLLNEILGNPAGFYVNVHNATYPGGAVRGQLRSLFSTDM